MRLAALLLLAGCSGTTLSAPLDSVYCGPADDRVFYPPSGFSVEDDADIRRAAEVWSARLPRPFIFSANGWQRILSWYPQPLPSGRWKWLQFLSARLMST